MKRFGIIFMSLMFMVMVSMAQPGQRNVNPEEMAKRQTEQLKEAIGLDAKQEKQVYDLNLETSKKMREMREKMQGNASEGMREKMTELRDEQTKKMKTILTAEQWTKYEKYQQERRERFGNRPSGPR